MSGKEAKKLNAEGERGREKEREREREGTRQEKEGNKKKKSVLKASSFVCSHQKFCRSLDLFFSEFILSLSLFSCLAQNSKLERRKEKRNYSVGNEIAFDVLGVRASARLLGFNFATFCSSES